MADVTLPQLGETVTEGTITQWFKAVGDTVEIDEPLFEVSTDKVDSEVPSPASGVLTEIRVPEGETVDVGTVLAVVGDADAAPEGGGASEQDGAGEPSAPSGSDSPDEGRALEAESESEPEPEPQSQQRPEPASAAGSGTTTGTEPADEAAPETDGLPSSESADDGDAGEASRASAGILLSPVVRSLVNEHGLDATKITGTGPGGRITRGDVESLIDERARGGGSRPEPADTPPPAAAPSTPASTAPTGTPSPRPAPDRAPAPPGGRDTVEAFNKMRKLTGDHMVHSKAVAPHVLMTAEADYEAVEVVRRRHGETFKAEEGFSLSYLPFVTMATVDAIRDFPHVNASVGDGSLIVHGDINIGIAVDLNHEGLIVPVMHGADGLRLRAVAREIRALAERARSNRLSVDDITGGTFTVSNPGPFGTHFTGAIINQPQVAILSVEGVSRKPVVVTSVDGTEAIGIHSVGLLALSFDHRAFDGAYAAAFLDRVRHNLATRDWEVELA